VYGVRKTVSPHTEQRSVVVVGAGLSGLTAGYRLQQAGVRVLVLERAGAAPAGRAISLRRDGFTFDRGADALVDAYAEYFALARELGLAASLRPIDAPLGTIRGGRVIVYRNTPLSLALTSLISPIAKLRLAAGVARLRRALARASTIDLHELADLDDQRSSALRLSDRYMGREATDYRHHFHARHRRRVRPRRILRPGRGASDRTDRCANAAPAARCEADGARARCE
jgi:phytoene dehydrogenase-like protein